MLLYEKYTPYSLNGIIGNGEAVAAIKRFGEDVLAGKKPKPILLYGPPGTGKTTAAKALASMFGFGLILLSASDYRDADTLRKKLLPATVSKGLFSKTNLIVFDEIDELSSQFDKGAQGVIVQILQHSRQPVLLIANDFWSQSISFLRAYVERVEFKKLSTEEILSFIRGVAGKEGAKIDDEVLKAVAERCNGDLRAALNDLEFAMGAGPDALDYLGVRNQKLEIFRVLDRIFLTCSFETAKSAFDNSDVDFDMLVKWIDENIPNRYYTYDSLGNAYDRLATASAYSNKAGRIGYYSLLRYASILASSGVSIASSGRVKRLGSYAFPKQVKYLSSTKQERLVLNSLAAKLAKRVHASRRELLTGLLPLFRIMLESKAKTLGKDEVAKSLESEFGLEKEEIALLL
ncbi:MAG: replication factor C large subunit [Candidatus Micrarchaeia archaeon]